MRDPWREGRWVDLWSVVHLHAGFLVGWFLLAVGLSIPATVAATLLALAAYEVVEVAAGVREHVTNRIVDVVVGMGGLALAWPARGAGVDLLVVVVAASFVLLNVLGWLAWRRRQRRG